MHMEAILSNKTIASMTISPTLYTSRTDEWPTPAAFFAELDREFGFTLDPCATRQNAKCRRFLTRDEDGLSQDWGTRTVFCNPPYGRAVGAWARKCHEAARAGATVVLLIPARTDTRYFHEWIYGKYFELAGLNHFEAFFALEPVVAASGLCAPQTS